MTENLLVLVGAACIVGATAGLAGGLWALLLLGILLVAMAYALSTQAPAEVSVETADVQAAIDAALERQARTHEIDRESAVALATARLTEELEGYRRRETLDEIDA